MYNLTAKYRILELCDCEMKHFITEFNAQMIVLMQYKRNKLVICQGRCDKTCRKETHGL